MADDALSVDSRPAASGRPAPTALGPDRPDRVVSLAVRSARIARVLFAVVAGVSSMVLLGYAIRRPGLVTLLPGAPPIYPTMAICLLAGGVAGLLLGIGTPAARRGAVLAGAVILLGAVSTLTLVAVDAGRTPFEWLWSERRPLTGHFTPVAGRMTADAATALIFFGIAIVAAGLRWSPRFVQALAIATLTVGFAGALARVVGIRPTVRPIPLTYIGMAASVAVLLVMLGAGLVLLRPSVGIVGLVTAAGPVGAVVRRLFAVALLAPLLLAGLGGVLSRALPPGSPIQSLVWVLQAAALGALVLVPAAAVERLERSARAATRLSRGRRESRGDTVPVIERIAASLGGAPPAVPGWELAVRQESAEGLLAGDFRAVLPREDGHALLAVVDVAGHGALPGLLAFRLNAEVEAMWFTGVTLAALAARLNESVIEADSMATAVLLDIDANGQVAYVNAGHPAPVFVHGSRTTLLARTGTVFGVRHRPHGVERLRAVDGDMIVAYTDGVIEARDGTRSQLGAEAVALLVAARSHEAPDAVAEAVVDTALTHADGRLDDDALVLALTRRR